VNYSGIKRNWGREEYIIFCSKDERKCWAWWRLEILKLGGCMAEFLKGQYMMCGELEDGKRNLLECSETKN
jgi:hypothetical protein